MAKRQDFYATKGDLEKLFREIDSTLPPLKFAISGSKSAYDVRVYDSLLQFPLLGEAISPVAIGNYCFYVVDKDSKAITVGTSKEDEGVTCDLDVAVFLRLGGILKDGILIQSEISVQSEDPAVLRVFDSIRKLIQRQSIGIRSTRVFPGAEKLLDQGWLLTDMANTTKERRLTRETANSREKTPNILTDLDKLLDR